MYWPVEAHYKNYNHLGCGNSSFEISDIPPGGLVLTSTNFPLSYPKGDNCANIIRVKEDQRIRLTFLMLDIQPRDETDGYW